MLYIFLNPNKKLNSHICHILDKSQLDYEIHYPNSINDLDDIDLEHNSSNIALSVLSKVIFPEKFLVQFDSAFNIHPGPKDYPGFGYNFALLNNEKNYGAVCHYMKKEIDTGDIIIESNFEISELESVDTLQFKTYFHVLIVLMNFINCLKNKTLFNLKKNKWTRKPYLKKDFLEMIEKIDDKDTKELFTKYPDSDKPLVEKYF